DIADRAGLVGVAAAFAADADAGDVDLVVVGGDDVGAGDSAGDPEADSGGGTLFQKVTTSGTLFHGTTPWLRGEQVLLDAYRFNRNPSALQRESDILILKKGGGCGPVPGTLRGRSWRGCGHPEPSRKTQRPVESPARQPEGAARPPGRGRGRPGDRPPS